LCVNLVIYQESKQDTRSAKYRTDFVYLVYFTLLHVSAVQSSHHQVGHGYTQRVKERSLSLQTAAMKFSQNNYNRSVYKSGRQILQLHLSVKSCNWTDYTSVEVFYCKCNYCDRQVAIQNGDEKDEDCLDWAVTLFSSIPPTKLGGRCCGPCGMLHDVGWQFTADVKRKTSVLSSRAKQFKKTTWPSKTGLICCLETSEINYQSTPRNISEEQGPQLHSGGSLKPRKLRGTVELLLSGRWLSGSAWTSG